MIVCERCRIEVNPDDPDVISAYEQRDTTTFGSGGYRETSDSGPKVCFHQSCFPQGSSRYRIAD